MAFLLEKYSAPHIHNTRVFCRPTSQTPNYNEVNTLIRVSNNAEMKSIGIPISKACPETQVINPVMSVKDQTVQTSLFRKSLSPLCQSFVVKRENTMVNVCDVFSASR
jgi:hypothetical protein